MTIAMFGIYDLHLNYDDDNPDQYDDGSWLDLSPGARVCGCGEITGPEGIAARFLLLKC